jgi:hypothetical protein
MACRQTKSGGGWNRQGLRWHVRTELASEPRLAHASAKGWLVPAYARKACLHSKSSRQISPFGDTRSPRSCCPRDSEVAPQSSLRAIVSRSLVWLQTKTRVPSGGREGQGNPSAVQKFLSAGVMEGGKYQATRVGTPQGGVVSPLLANIALNLMDWKLEEAGYRFVRYADDFVVLCKSERQAKEALELVSKILADQLSLALSPEKTHITTFKKGFAFLGFQIGAWRIRMRDKSKEKFKDKVREITTRSHNLDAEMIEQLNRVIRGTANYFTRPWSACGHMYRTLDRWIRMRLRCMKSKRKSSMDNRRTRLVHFENMGLLSLCHFIPERVARTPGLSLAGAIPTGSPGARKMHAGK